MSWIDHAARVLLRTRGVAGRSVRTAVARHHVYDAPGGGTLPPVVILPGLAATATSHAPLLLRLRPHVRRVVVLDNAGHGLSSAASGRYTVPRHLASITEAIAAVIDEPALVLGNSLGGATAMHVAAERPELVRGLFLTSPAAMPLSPEVRDDLRRAFAMRNRKEAVDFIARVLHRRPLLAPLVAGSLLRQAAAPAIADILASMEGEHATPEQLAALRIPTTLLWGRSERLLPAEGLAYLREHLPAHVRVLQPPGLGHCPHIDAPARLAREVLAFARSL